MDAPPQNILNTGSPKAKPRLIKKKSFLGNITNQVEDLWAVWDGYYMTYKLGIEHFVRYIVFMYIVALSVDLTWVLSLISVAFVNVFNVIMLAYMSDPTLKIAVTVVFTLLSLINALLYFKRTKTSRLYQISKNDIIPGIKYKVRQVENTSQEYIELNLWNYEGNHKTFFWGFPPTSPLLFYVNSIVADTWIRIVLLLVATFTLTIIKEMLDLFSDVIKGQTLIYAEVGRKNTFSTISR